MKCKAVGPLRKKFVLGLILINALAFCFQFPVLAGQSVSLTWDAPGNANIVGYKIYYGTASHTYDHVLGVGNTTTTTISGLAEGVMYYFVATAIDSAGNESDFSNETAFVATADVTTVAATISSVTLSGGQFGFAVSGVNGRTCIVQASSDLVNWVAVFTNTAPFIFTDPNTGSYSRRFYRTYTATP